MERHSWPSVRAAFCAATAPMTTNRRPPVHGLLDAAVLKSDRHMDGTIDTAVYVNGSGSYAVWVIGRQAVVWSLP